MRRDELYNILPKGKKQDGYRIMKSGSKWSVGYVEYSDDCFGGQIGVIKTILTESTYDDAVDEAKKMGIDPSDIKLL